MQKREKISLKDGVLYRTIIDPQEQEVQQLVLPEILRERVIRSLHNDMGHQGLDIEPFFWLDLDATGRCVHRRPEMD